MYGLVHNDDSVYDICLVPLLYYEIKRLRFLKPWDIYKAEIWVCLFSMLQQTNTADMLEEAVEYVKALQSQIQVSIHIYSI